MSQYAANGTVHGLLILSSAVIEGTDEGAFHDWYNKVHVPDILTIPEFISCRRYRVAEARLNPGILAQPSNQFAAIYEVEAKTEEDMHRAVANLNSLGRSGISVSPAFDSSRTWATFLLPISDGIVKDPNYEHSGTSNG